jgi:hypothetical protein
LFLSANITGDRAARLLWLDTSILALPVVKILSFAFSTSALSILPNLCLPTLPSHLFRLLLEICTSFSFFTFLPHLLFLSRKVCLPFGINTAGFTRKILFVLSFKMSFLLTLFLSLHLPNFTSASLDPFAAAIRFMLFGLNPCETLGFVFASFFFPTFSLALFTIFLLSAKFVFMTLVLAIAAIFIILAVLLLSAFAFFLLLLVFCQLKANVAGRADRLAIPGFACGDRCSTKSRGTSD